jgi:predicted DNA-binding transcriptional regulator AlpA
MATLLTLKEFLAQNRISRATFYRLPADHKPRTVRISRKILIRPEDAKEWQRRMARACVGEPVSRHPAPPTELATPGAT